MTLDDLILPGTRPEVLGDGYGFCEGPAADGEGNVYFSDGKNDAIHCWRPGQPVELFTGDSTDANGMMFNARGELYVCQGAAYRVVAFDVTTKHKRVLAGEIDGVHFNEPNDLAIDRHDGFYFSDPNYQHRGQPTVMKQDVYYCSAAGHLSRVSAVCFK
ncbi:MAG TPA: SMP-30/gluconolactonase/LRE family protein, partial [Thermoguttaceae bacterium]|nr:SMP-30/gluconolactonase/LRE family protein [Thermoguttaceae bacterium]